MTETNSEQKPLWMTIGMSVLMMLLMVMDQILGWGVIPKEHAVYGVMTTILAIAASTGVYTLQRPMKHNALANRVLAEKANPKP